MKTWALCGVVFALILGVVAGREFFIQEEIKSQRVELEDNLIRSLADARSFDRLREISESSRLYPKYLEPVVSQASRLLWVPTREQILKDWERRVHQLVEDRSYARWVELKDQTQKQIAAVIAKDRPSLTRLLQLNELGQGLPDSLDRVTLLKQEAESIQAANQKIDQEKLIEVKKRGGRSLKILRSKQKKMSREEFQSYLMSASYFKDIEAPVLGLILEIRNTELRKETWKEFSNEKLKVFKNPVKAPSLVGELKNTPTESAVKSLAELLKREYEKDIEEQKKHAAPIITPSNPIDSALPHRDADIKVFE